MGEPVVEVNPGRARGFWSAEQVIMEI